jgi:hypothetical protein
VHQPGAQFYDRFVEDIKTRIRTANTTGAILSRFTFKSLGCPSPHLWPCFFSIFPSYF